MKIALFTYNIGHGGKTSHIIDLTKGFVEKGHEVFIYTTGTRAKNDIIENEKLNSFEKFGAKLVKLNYRKSNINIIRKVQTVIFILRIKFFLVSKNIDIVHVHDSSFAALLSKLNIPFISTHHMGFDIDKIVVKSFHEIAISREVYLNLKKWFSYREDEVSLVYNGVDIDFSKLASSDELRDIKNQKQIPQDKIIIGVIGDITRLKAPDILLNAISNLHAQTLKKVHLVIVGRPRGTENKRWFAELLEVHSNLIPLISVFDFTEPKPFYDIIDIFVSPSRSETFSLVIAEAMLSGCCVVRSETGGAHDQIIMGETGFIFPVENSDKLTEILEGIIINDHLRIKVADKGRQNALKLFTSDIMVEKTLDVYEKVLLSRKNKKQIL